MAIESTVLTSRFGFKDGPATYLKPIFLTLLTRMQATKTDKFVYLFARFFLYTMAINKEGFTPDHIISVIEEIQPEFVMLNHRLLISTKASFLSRLWSKILNNFLIPEAPNFSTKDRKLAAIGITRMITESTFMLQEPSVRSWYVNLTFIPDIHHLTKLNKLKVCDLHFSWKVV